MVAIDTETNGLDFRHGARPFYVTITNPDETTDFWEWDVDPLTRHPIIPAEDLAEIEERCLSADSVVFHNAKFDITALESIIPGIGAKWPWERTHDTLYLAHLLGSNLPKNLTALAVQYLGIDIEPFETAIDKAVTEARRLCRRKDFIERHGEWRIAKQGLPEMPSAKEKCGKNDMWLPRAVAKAEWESSKAGQSFEQAGQDGEPYPVQYAMDLPGWEWRPPGVNDENPKDAGHPWWTVLQEYANPDSVVTLALCREMMRIVRERGLEAIYETRRKLIPVVYEMERAGVTVNKRRVRELADRYRVESHDAGLACKEIAAEYGYDLCLPKSGNNRSLTEFCFGRMPSEEEVTGLLKGRLLEPFTWLDLPVVGRTDTGNPSLDKGAMEAYLATLPEGNQRRFIEELVGKRSRDTGISYLEGYERFWLPLGARHPDWFRLFPSLNATGTDTLRCSSQNPNAQNISKKENFNLRYGFGPAPGREWWCLDASNIELRLPAYESGEEEIIALFEKPDAPPYYGSNHLLVFDILHPEKFKEHGKDCKKIYASTWYQWTKNGNFAVQYGAVDKADGTGTADRAYHVPGAQAKIAARFRKLDALNKKWIAFANKHGYVETMPDRTVDPKRGYPILCTRTERGRVLETVPLNYHVQSTAMWWMGKAMIRCAEYLRSTFPSGKITAQVHDELVFDLPKGKGLLPWKTNAGHVRELKRLMEMGGDDVGVPTPVNVEYCPNTWAETEGVNL